MAKRTPCTRQALARHTLVFRQALARRALGCCQAPLSTRQALAKQSLSIHQAKARHKLSTRCVLAAYSLDLSVPQLTKTYWFITQLLFMLAQSMFVIQLQFSFSLVQFTLHASHRFIQKKKIYIYIFYLRKAPIFSLQLACSLIFLPVLTPSFLLCSVCSYGASRLQTCV